MIESQFEEIDEVRLVAWEVSVEHDETEIGMNRGWTLRTMTWDQEH